MVGAHTVDISIGLTPDPFTTARSITESAVSGFAHRLPTRDTVLHLQNTCAEHFPLRIHGTKKVYFTHEWLIFMA